MTRSSKKQLIAPRTIVLELTRACNHKCAHCYTVWGAPELKYDCSSRRPLSTAAWKKIVSKVHAEVPTLESVALSGGEPLLYEDLTELVRFITRRKLSVVIITNGSMLTRERMRELAAAGAYFEVPLLSHRAAIHDRLTGKPNSWNKTVANLANSIALRAGWVCVFVATKLNWRDLPKTGELAIALGAEGLMYNRVNLSAGNLSNARILVPTPFMIERNLHTLQRLKTRFQLPSAVSVVIEPCVVDIDQFPDIQFGWCPLAGENSYFTIDPYGNLRICNHSPTVLGNLTESDFMEIFRNHSYVRRFRTELPLECKNCPPRWRNLCRGGCKAAGEQCYGDPAKVDPFVTMFSDRKK
jgi:PqqA peptide cyclase